MQEIRLERVLPRVFVNERISASDVWLGDLAFRRGEFALVEAQSGGGKSSMCAYIYGSRTDYEGRIIFDTSDIRGLDMNRWLSLRRTNLAYLPQELALFPELSAWENIQLKNRLTRHATDAQVESWLEELGLAARRDFPVGKMSIGQQQRVAIIRAICQPFDFLLVDEPVSHLDEANNGIASKIITEEARRQGAGIISTSVGNRLDIDYDKRLKL